MAEVTVKQLAQVVGTPVEKLLEQLRDAGIEKSGEGDVISDAEKGTLLSHLRQSRGEATSSAGSGRKITLRRKRVSELKSDSSGRKKVNVEVRGRRTYVKPGDQAQAEMDEEERAADSAKEVEQAEEAFVEQDVAASASEATVADTPVDDAASAEAAAVAAADAVAAEVAQRVSQEPESEPEAEPDPAELERQRIAALKAAAAEEMARSAAERQAEKHFAAEKRKESEEASRLEAERREQQRLAEEAQRRAAVEAQQAASSSDRGSGGRNDGKGKGRGKGKGGGGGDTRYGRNQLHVAKDKSGRRKGKPRRALPSNFESKHGFEKPTTPVVRDVDVPETITVAELANKMAVKAGEVIKSMMGMGVMATINQMLDQDTAILVVEEMGHRAIAMSDDDIEAALAERIIGVLSGENEEPRPPVVTVMGHVDHGKTSLLDYIRHSRVAAGEAGGITQHIGAYQSQTDKGTITFLDTPGHAAFSAMRSRGAQSTDIVVLVVAADDGVMPQTIEGVQHARAAKVPLIVAVNKMDKEGADPERVRNELSQHEVISEDWGGDTQFVPVSALTGDGIDDLLDAIRLQAEVLELKASPEGAATGVVIEAALDKGRGPVATVLVQSGTLKRGDIIICGQETGRVRAMFDENGKNVETAGPSTPVQVLGLSATPNAGDEMLVAADDKSARELAELREGKQRDARLADRRPQKLDDVFSQFKSGELPTVNMIVKADVKGSFEAIRDALEKLSTEEVSVRVIGGGVGGITESDANLAATSGATLVGFNTRADNSARRIIQENDIELRYYSVIYELIDLVKSVAGGMLPPEVRERIIGTAEVKDVFTSPKFGQIAGCMVVDGVVRKDEPIRVLRENVVIYEGELESLRRFKDDVKEVNMGTECGIGVKNYTDVKPGDQIEVFERTEVARTL
jgi:translation initiation factor IF-2